VQQLTTCNARHSVEARLDRIGSEQLALTKELMAQMLG